jgi:hypothetical protein
MWYYYIRMKQVNKTKKTTKKNNTPKALTIAAAIADLEYLAAVYGIDTKLVCDVTYDDGRNGTVDDGLAIKTFARICRNEKDEVSGIYFRLVGNNR